MRRYANRSGRGGVSHYEIGPGFIELRFANDERVYVYNERRPGRAKVLMMQHLAEEGEGLTTFVNQHVRGDYDRWYVPATTER